MSVDVQALPWDVIETMSDDVPWEAMHAFADALAADASLLDELAAAYERSFAASAREDTFTFALAPPIIELASPRLDEALRRDAAQRMLGWLRLAGEAQDDVTLERLTEHIGALGASALPPLFDALEQLKPDDGGWFHTWGLIALVLETPDESLRQRAAGLCMRALRKAADGGLEPNDVLEAARTAAGLGVAEARPLLERLLYTLKRKPGWFQFGVGDFREAIDILDGLETIDVSREPWHRPLAGRVTTDYQSLCEWYAERKDLPDDDQAGFDDDFEAQLRQADDLARRFCESPAGRALAPSDYENAPFILHCFTEYGVNFCGATPGQLTVADAEEVLLDVFPRKVSADQDTFECVAPVVEAFLRWLGDEGLHGNVEPLIRSVQRNRGLIVRRSQDPSRWGMAKSFHMAALDAGVDPADESQMQGFMMEYNARLAASRAQSLERSLALQQEGAWHSEGDYYGPVEQVRRDGPKVGRNEPCPCGSGKKYKKCCWGRE